MEVIDILHEQLKRIETQTNARFDKIDSKMEILIEHRLRNKFLQRTIKVAVIAVFTIACRLFIK